MKTRCLALAVLLLSLLCGSALADEKLPWELRLPFKEATIHYELKGTQQGTDTLYVKDFGKIRAKHHAAVTAVMGRSNKSETLEITDPDWVYTYNLTEKKGEKFTNPMKLYQAEYNKFNAEEKKNFEKNSKELGSSMMGKYGGSVTQNGAKILGYDCDVSTVGGMSKVYLLHGSDLTLRSEVSAMGVANTVNATQIDTTTPVKESAFAPPAGVTATLNQEMEDMMTETVQNMMATLKRPDGAEVIKKSGPGMMMPTKAMKARRGMEEDGAMDKEEHQQMMQQMDEAMKQLKQMKTR